jgi:hypothetical protein
MLARNNSAWRIHRFKESLKWYKEKGLVKLLYRGIDKRSAFRPYNLDPTYNTIEQFAESLFYFGEKSKYYWENRFGRGVTLNDVTRRMFRYIFDRLHEVATLTEAKKGTIRYRDKNKKAFRYFSDKKNVTLFLKNIMKLNSDQRRRYRNYYLRIIHQLGETEYNERSLHVSATESTFWARRFGKGEIVIYFWDFDFNHFQPIEIDIPVFVGKPYRSQQEISLFSAIFPHHIFSFHFEGREYINPALFRHESIRGMILNGFTIDQTDFKERLKTTNIRRGVQRTGVKYSEIPLSAKGKSSGKGANVAKGKRKKDSGNTRKK